MLYLSSAANNKIIAAGETLWQQTLVWLQSSYVELLSAAVISLLTFAVTSWLRRRAAAHAQKNDGKTGFWALTARVLARTSVFFLIILSIEIVVGFTNAPEQLDWLSSKVFIVALVFQMAIWARALILGLVEQRTLESGPESAELANAQSLIRVIVTVVLFILAAIIVLDNLGVNVTALIAGLGVGGIAIGLAAQGIFSDLFSALSIIFDKPFRKGDYIMYDGFDGQVEATGLKTTHLRSITGEQVIMSNTNLLDKEIRNMTRLSKRRIRFNIGVIYQTTPEQLEAIPGIFKTTIEELGHKYIRCGFVGFGDSALNFRMEFEILSASWNEVFSGRNDVGLALVKRFAQEGIEFAYPTQVNFTANPDGSMASAHPGA